MPDRERLDRRLRAVERTLTGDDHDLETLTETGDIARRVEQLESELESATARIEELEAATQALRGYVGNVRSVNQDVERRADAAIAAVDRLEDEFQQDERGQTRQPGDVTRSRVPPGRGPESSERPGSDESGVADSMHSTRATQPETGAGDCDADQYDADDTGGVLDRLRLRL